MNTQITPRHALRILCVDDNVELVELVSDMLRFYGYHVECVYDGDSALQLVEAGPENFDVIVTDLQMPGLDGRDLIVAARAAGFRGRVVVYSGALTLKERQRFGELAVEAIVDKPANHRELIGVIARLQTELWERASADAA